MAAETYAAGDVLDAASHIKLVVSQVLNRPVKLSHYTDCHSLVDAVKSENQNKLAERIARLRGKVRRMDALLEGLSAKSLSEQQKSVIKRSYQKLLAEAVTLRSEAIVSSSDQSQGNRLAIFETLKEMNNMTKNRSRAIFNQLFEAGYLL